ncbi:group II intron reverse transcriptase/maturase [Breznakia sp. OttesenSCG-928-G09]|nr:group II intron reverse transcriptase/maturase [Breznakia sp. OttesenSCG-928-G09]
MTTNTEASYGFRPKRSCEMAILKVLDYLNDGYEWMVDIDLEKFFDRVSQDKLMSYTHDIVQDGDVESLITRYLKSGVMSEGKYKSTNIGTPQGGNLSPLLSNIMLNKLDKELETRGLRFARYADDVVILVGSEASAKRVMHSITKWIEKKLRLTVNMTKTKVNKPTKTKFLGFGFYKNRKDGTWRCKPHEESVVKFKAKLKTLTSRKWSISLKERIKKINQVTRGWINYFAISSMKAVIREIDSHLRTRIRVIIWKQWKTPQKRQWGLQKLGIHKDLARQTSYMGRRYQFIVLKTCVVRAISKQKLAQKGLVSCFDYYEQRHNLKFN